MRSFRLDRRLSLVEVLVVAAILGVFAIVAVPLLEPRRGNPISPIREARWNLMPIATGMERGALDRGGSFVQREPSMPCALVATYGKGEGVPALNLSIQGELWSYTIQTIDADGDGRCEAYTITATGLRKPTLGKSLGIDSSGRRFGDWK